MNSSQCWVRLYHTFRDKADYVFTTDNIESNVINVANDTEGASSELTTAHEYQKKAGRRMFILLMIFCLVRFFRLSVAGVLG